MFKKGCPVTMTGCEKEMNLFLGFYTYLPKREKTVLRIAGCSLYSVFVNGSFVFSGPARAAHGFYRVDEIPLDSFLTEERSAVTVLLAGYNCNSFSLIDMPTFLCAEIENADGIAAYTDEGEGGGFSCVLLDERIQKVFRYSFQRNFTEAYRLNERYPLFFSDPASSMHKAIRLSRTESKRFLPRGVFYPLFETEYPSKRIASGKVSVIPDPPVLRNREHIKTDIFKCFPEEELEYKYIDEIRRLSFTAEEREPASAPCEIALSPMRYVDLTFSSELTGLIGLELICDTDSEIILLFDEVYNHDTVDPFRMACGNCITLFAAAGKYSFLTAEPYSFKYLRVVCRTGSAVLRNIHIRRTGFSEIEEKPDFADPDLALIYDAAVETFRQNTYDIYMDCPSRERAGWLCDSFFTSRVEYALTGKSDVERNFLSNFLDGEHYPDIPEGMLPMCYPADHTDHVYIPNWAMWFVLELEEYWQRTGNRALIDRARKKTEALLAFLRSYENEVGLLEKLDSWVFVEWSRANALVQDVNFPTNMLYAAMKRAMYALYGEEKLLREAEQIEKYIRENTVVNGFFCDNALRLPDGGLKLSGECTETCQYYAFTFGIATPESYPDLWQKLIHDFGPQRKENNRYPAVAFANSFIGNYLRLELLSRYGLEEQLIAEIKGYFLYMAKKTGTLWENDTDYASCNHGFASYVAVWLRKAGLSFQA